MGVSIDFISNSKQNRAMISLQDDHTREILYGGGAGGSKSFTGCAWLITMCVTLPGTRWLMGRAKKATLKITTLKTFFDVAKMMGLKEEIHYRYYEKKELIEFSNGSEIVLKDMFQYPSDPNFDSLGSLEISGGFIDEVAEVTNTAKAIALSRCRYKLFDFCPHCNCDISKVREVKIDQYDNLQGKPIYSHKQRDNHVDEIDALREVQFKIWNEYKDLTFDAKTRKEELRKGEILSELKEISIKLKQLEGGFTGKYEPWMKPGDNPDDQFDYEKVKICPNCKRETTGRVPKMFMSCNPCKNWAYSDFYMPDKQKNMPEDKIFIKALPKDNPFLSREYVLQLQKLPELHKKRLLLGLWEYDDDIGTMMDYNKILEIFTNNHVRSGRKYITADIARQGRDKTRIILWNGWRAVKMWYFDKNLVTEAADKIKEIMASEGVPKSRVAVDEDGVGGGVVDIIGCVGIVNNSSPILIAGEKENFANLKSQLAFYFANAVKENDVFIDTLGLTKEDYATVQTEIIQELEQVKRKDADHDSQYRIYQKHEVKANIGRSPDYSDALIFRAIFELIKWQQYV